MTDDWKEEILSRLNNSLIYKTLKNNCSEKDNDVIALVDNAVHYAYQRTKTIVRHVGEFTLHDSDHLFRVLYLMERLLTKDNIKIVSSPELINVVSIKCFFPRYRHGAR